MHTWDVLIDAGIAVTVAVIAGIGVVLYRRGEFDDPYHEIPTQRFGVRPPDPDDDPER